MREAGRRPPYGFGLMLGGWLLAVPVPAAAQSAAILSQLESLVPAGAFVVVETIDGRTVKGRLRSLSESGLIFDKPGAPTIPLEWIRTLSRRVGRRPWLKGLIVGAAAGAGVGALIPPPMLVLYRAPSSSRVSIAPVVAGRVRGIAVSVTF